MTSTLCKLNIRYMWGMLISPNKLIWEMDFDFNNYGSSDCRRPVKQAGRVNGMDAGWETRFAPKRSYLAFEMFP